MRHLDGLVMIGGYRMPTEQVEASSREVGYRERNRLAPRLEVEYELKRYEDYFIVKYVEAGKHVIKNDGERFG